MHSAGVYTPRPERSDDPARRRNEIWRAATLLKSIYRSGALGRARTISRRDGSAFSVQVLLWLEYEQRRLAVLHGLKILDTELDPVFDELVSIAADVCNTPIASINLIDEAREWRAATINLPEGDNQLRKSACARLIDENDLVVIPDMAMDWRTRSLVAGGDNPAMRFYASTPIKTGEGVALGRLCVVDTVPRPDGLNPGQAQTLLSLARQIASQVELRHSRFPRGRGV